MVCRGAHRKTQIQARGVRNALGLNLGGKLGRDVYFAIKLYDGHIWFYLYIIYACVKYSLNNIVIT